MRRHREGVWLHAKTSHRYHANDAVLQATHNQGRVYASPSLLLFHGRTVGFRVCEGIGFMPKRDRSHAEQNDAVL